MNAPLTLSIDQRAIVRKAITAHPDWKEYSRKAGLTAADMTSARCLDACAALGIDVQRVLDLEAPAMPLPVAAPVAPPAAAPHAPAADDALAALVALQRALGGAVDEGKVRAIVDAALAPVLAAIGQPALLVVDRDGAAMGKPLPPVRHPLLDKLLTACAARDAHGHRLNVWMAGPAGSGKTHAAGQVASALGLPFGFHGAMTMPHELVGFVDAGGTYRETVFVRLLRDGGVCLLDEVDAGSNEALLALNAALANGKVSLPSGELIDRHPDFVCIGAANTWGSGATADYIGRAKLDAAFLDRFGFRLAWGYDPALEVKMCGNADWAKEVQKARAACIKLGLKVIITPRASMAGAALLAAGMSLDEARAGTYLSGLTVDQAAMLSREMGL